MAEGGEGPEIVRAPNPFKGIERTHLVPSTEVDLRRRAAAQVGLESFSVIKGAGGTVRREGKDRKLPKNKALVREGWYDITDSEKIAAYRKRVAELLAEQRAARKQKRK